MSIIKGIIKQKGKQKQPEGTCYSARNIVLGDTLDFPSNEPSTSIAYEKGKYGTTSASTIAFAINEDTPTDQLITSVLTNQDRQVLGLVGIENKVIVFSKGKGVNDGFDEIGVVERNNNLGVYKPIIRSAYLNFKLHNPIKGVATVNFYKQVVVAWVEGVREDANNIRLLNIDCLPITLDANLELTIPDEIALLDLFANYTTPSFTLVNVNEFGGNLRTGVYYFTGQYEYKDGSTTTFFPIQNPISIIKDTGFINTFEINGALPDTVTNKSIDIQFSNLDQNFKSLRIYVIKEIGSIISQFYVDKIEYAGTSLSYRYTGLVEEEPVSPEEILVNSAIYTKAFGITNYRDELDLANLVTEDDINLQQCANDIVVRWTTKEVSLIKTWESYRDSKFIFYNRSFKSNEVYALYMRGITAKGGRTKAFHIAGRLASDSLNGNVFNGDPNGTGERQILAYTDDDALNPNNVRWFQTRETARVDIGNPEERLMGYWENENEVYKGVCMGTDKDGEPMDGKKVRHHRFPNISTLIDEALFKDEHTATVIEGAEIDGLPSLRHIKLGTVGTVNGTGLLTANDPLANDFGVNTVVATESILFDFTLNVETPITIVDSVLWTNCIIFNANNTIADVVIIRQDNYSTGGDNVRLQHTVRLEKGQKFSVRLEFDNPVIGLPVQLDAAIIFTPIVVSGNNATTCKVLGLELDNVVIPTEHNDKIKALEFFYAKRTFNNSIISSQVVVVSDEFRFTTDLDSVNFYTPPVELVAFRLHSFDVNFYKPELNINYLNILAEYNKGNYATTSFGNQVKRVTNLEYRLINNSVGNNGGREAALHGVINTADPVLNGYADKFYVADLCAYKTDVYNNYESQELVSTGILLYNDNSGLLSVTTAAGDTYKSLYGVRVKNRWYDPSYGDDNTQAAGSTPRIRFLNYRDFLPLLDSVANIDFREVASEPLSPYNHDRYFPFANLQGIGFQNSNNGVAFYDRDNVHKYNKDYSAVNKFSQAKIHVCLTNCELFEDRYYPSRIARSATNKNEEFILNWRTFPPENYYEMPKTRGEIWNIDTDGFEFYINHKYGFYVATFKDVLNFENGSAYLGTGDIFDRPPVEIVSDKLGYIGCQSRWGCLLTRNGYVMVDRKKGKVFLYNKELKDLTLEVLEDWCELNINTLNRSKLSNIFNDLDGSLIAENMDNPFTQIGICLGYDPRMNRILLTKHDYEVVGDFNTGVNTSIIAKVTVVNRTATVLPEVINSQSVNTIALFLNWKDLNPADDTYDFTDLQNTIIAIIAAGKKFAIKIATGKQAPSWLVGLGVPYVQFYEFEGSNPNLVSYNLPVFWDATYINRWQKFLSALSDLINNNGYSSKLEYVTAWGIGRSSDEFRFCAQVNKTVGIYTSTDAVTLWNGAGYTNDIGLATFKQFALAMFAAFPTTKYVLPFVPSGVPDMGDNRNLYEECFTWLQVDGYVDNVYVQYTAVKENYNGTPLADFAKVLGFKIAGQLSEKLFSNVSTNFIQFSAAIDAFFANSGVNSFIEVFPSNVINYYSKINSVQAYSNGGQVSLTTNGNLKLDNEDLEFNNENSGRFTKTGFTLSYSFKNENWLAYHDYLPNAMVRTSDNSFYLVDNYQYINAPNLRGLLWRHHSKASYNRYFLHSYDSWIDFTKASGIPSIFNFLAWKTTVFKVVNKVKQIQPEFFSTIKGIAAYNDTQLSPLYELTVANNDAFGSIKKDKCITRNNLDYWYYNKFFDHYKIGNQPFLIGIIDDIDYTQADEKVFYRQKNFYGTWTIFRLYLHLSSRSPSNVFGNESYENIYLEDIDTDVSQVKK